MHAVWLEHNALQLLPDHPVPSPQPGEALVRVRRAGICNTDLELVKGYYLFAGVPGHEFVGQVELAPRAEQWVGKRVVGEINLACGACAMCAAGHPRHCTARTVLGIKGRDGAFAEYLTLPVANLHEVPADLPDDVAVFTEPTAAAMEIRQQVDVRPGERVVVIGDGKLGNLVAQTLAATGCDLLAIGRHRSKLDLLEARGIRTGLAPDLPPHRADLVVECTGNPGGLQAAHAAVRPRGTIVLKSTYHGVATLDLSSIVVDEVTLIGSRCGPFRPALDALVAGEVDVRPLIHARYPLRDAVAAFAHAGRAGVLKVLLEG